ncbi:hypothetical protein [Actinomyces sp. ZJ308]|uniref:hypothetical protein n=1 Tax=Actinomyces sp. ZJ308 TaxID=2708342 RepID=UPI0014225C56|nr:hypothetical protein [Actinomyces sp. ZJ308]
MTAPQPVRPAIVARAVNSRLRVGRLTRAGQAVTLTQTDATTCGATCLLAARLLLAPGDRRALTDELTWEEAVSSEPSREGRRLARLLSRHQLRIQRVMNRSGLGPVPWPKALGSTPWAVARQMTEIVSTCAPGRERRVYAVRWVSDHGPAWEWEVASIREVLAGGLPVILVTGGPLALDHGAEMDRTVGARLRSALARTPAVPRHYVLALPWRIIEQDDPGEASVHIYEPSSGSVRALDLTVPRSPHRPGPRELGGWPRVLAVIAPEN